MQGAKVIIMNEEGVNIDFYIEFLTIFSTLVLVKSRIVKMSGFRKIN